MYYDTDIHKWVVEVKDVFERTGIDLTRLVNDPYVSDKNIAALNIMKGISTQLYTYVYSFNTTYNYYQEYLMAKSALFKQNFKEAVFLQLSYILTNGKINEFSGINMTFTDKNASLPMFEFRGERAIHPEAVQILKMPIENNVRLLYSGRFIIPTEIKYRSDY